MSLSELLQKKKHFANDKQIVLNYSHIKQIGASSHFQWVTTLCLSHNLLRNLKGIEQFTFLHTLSLHHNQLTSVKELHRISQPHLLHHLNVHHNPCTLNPNYTTEILLKFKQLKQLDSVTQINYKTYFLYTEEIGKMLIPYVARPNGDSSYLRQMKVELKKYDPSAEQLNRLLFNLLKSASQTHKINGEQNLHELGFAFFKKLFHALQIQSGGSDLRQCLLHISLQQEDADLFRFSNDIPYQEEIMYKQFLDLRSSNSMKFVYPHFPYYMEYLKAIIFALEVVHECYLTTRKHQFLSFPNEQNTQSNSMSSFRAVPKETLDFKENLPPSSRLESQTPNKQSFQTAGEAERLKNYQQTIRKQSGNLLAKVLRAHMNLVIKRAYCKIQDFAIYKYSRLQSLVQLKSRIDLKCAFRELHIFAKFGRMFDLLEAEVSWNKRAALDTIKCHQQIIYKKFEARAIQHFNFSILSKIFNQFKQSGKNRVTAKSKLQNILLRKKLRQLRYGFQRWKLIFFNQKYYEPLPNLRIKTQTSVSTKLPGRSQSQQHTFRQSAKELQVSDGTKIYCEYVVINQNQRKKKKKKKKSKKSKLQLVKKAKGSCGICREYVDENGRIVPHN